MCYVTNTMLSTLHALFHLCSQQTSMTRTIVGPILPKEKPLQLATVSNRAVHQTQVVPDSPAGENVLDILTSSIDMSAQGVSEKNTDFLGVGMRGYITSLTHECASSAYKALGEGEKRKKLLQKLKNKLLHYSAQD